MSLCQFLSVILFSPEFHEVWSVTYLQWCGSSLSYPSAVCAVEGIFLMPSGVLLFIQSPFDRSGLSFNALSACSFHNGMISYSVLKTALKVRPSQLVDYLQQKKAEGYTVIGVEQTAQSSDLAQYRFPEKSLLLLG